MEKVCPAPWRIYRCERQKWLMVLTLLESSKDLPTLANCKESPVHSHKVYTCKQKSQPICFQNKGTAFSSFGKHGTWLLPQCGFLRCNQDARKEQRTLLCVIKDITCDTLPGASVSSQESFSACHSVCLWGPARE